MQDNNQLIKDFYNSFRFKNENYLNYCHENIVWITMNGMPNGGTYFGVNSVFNEYFPKMLSNFKVFHADPKEFQTIDNRVIVFGSYVGKSKQDTSFEIPFCHVYQIIGDKISQFRQFIDTALMNEIIKV